MAHPELILESIDGLDPFPRAALRVLELAFQGAEPEKLVEVIERDPGLTSKVLQLANSAQMGSQVEIDSVMRATTRLGMTGVANLALTTGSASFLSGCGSATARSNESLWTECLSIAIYARRLAAADGRVDPELAYTVGLLQNLGHIAVDRFFGEAVEEIKVKRSQGLDLIRAERSVLGLDHAQCGALLARQWGLPQVLIRGIQFHHTAERAGEESLLCSICGLAEELAARSMSEGGDTTLFYDWETGGTGVACPEGEPLSEMCIGAQEELTMLQA